MVPEALAGLSVLFLIGLLLGGLAAVVCCLVKGTVRLLCAPMRLAMWAGLILLALVLLAGAC